MASGEPGDILTRAKITELDDDDEGFEDETLTERLYGLTEMFPERVRDWANTSVSAGYTCTKALYKFTRSSLWIGATSFLILVVPVVFEQERFSMEQQQLSQQRQMLLGPNAAMSGAYNMPQPGMAPPPPPK